MPLMYCICTEKVSSATSRVVGFVFFFSCGNQLEKTDFRVIGASVLPHRLGRIVLPLAPVSNLIRLPRPALVAIGSFTFSSPPTAPSIPKAPARESLLQTHRFSCIVSTQSFRRNLLLPRPYQSAVRSSRFSFTLPLADLYVAFLHQTHFSLAKTLLVPAFQVSCP